MGIGGFDKLQRQLQQAQRAVAGLDGEIAEIEFDPGDQASVEAAIRQMEQAIDTKVGQNAANNPLVHQIVQGLKDQYRAAMAGQTK